MLAGNNLLPVWQLLKPHFVILPVLVAVWFLTAALLKRTPGYTKNGKGNDWCVIASETLTLLLYVRFGWTLNFLKGVLLTLIFLYASFCDIRTRELRDGISVMVFLLGFVGRDLAALARPLTAALTAFAFLFYCAVLLHFRIGGADIKFIPAAVFVLGGERGLVGLLLGLILSVAGTLIRNKITKTRDDSLPMIPYLSAGFLSAFFI